MKAQRGKLGDGQQAALWLRSGDHIDVAAGVALLLAWEEAKRRGALAMKWDGAQWVVAIGGEWVALEVPKSFFSSKK